MHVAVVIVGFRNVADILSCLDSLSKSSHCDFEVVICENGGPEAVRILKRHLASPLPGGQPVRLIAADNPGYAGAINLCLAERPDADAWLILNPDARVAPNAVEHLVRKLKGGSCQAVGGVLQGENGHVQAYGGRWRPWLARAESLGNGRAASEPVDAARVEREQSYLMGACMLIGRDFLERTGPMREEYFLYCEEVEWCLRAVSRGIRLGFEPEARVFHDQGTTTGSNESVLHRPKLPIYLDERNKILVTRDHYPRRLVIAAVNALLLIFLRYARQGAWPQVGYAIEGWAAGIRNLRGVPKWLARPPID